MSAALEQAQRDVVAVCQALSARGLVYGTAGNVSIRVGETVVISPSSVRYETMTPEMVCMVNLDGERVYQGDHNPSSEVPMHLGIYRSTDALAVVHGHSPAAVAAGAVFDEIPAIHYVARNLGGAIPVVKYSRFGSDALAHDIAEALHNRNGALMRNHGAVTTGATVDEALERYAALEWLCDVTLRARSVGEPAVLSQAQLDEVTEAAKERGYTS